MTGPTIELLQNPIQEYDWGSTTAIAELLGQPTPSPSPQAELWMGAHPRAPSRILWQGSWRPLPELIQEYPEEILGPRTAQKFAGQLPFLFKVLAAARPLSLQAHPNKVQAEEGFARENSRGIPLDAPERNYKDSNHKPEIICALTDFWGLNGFRPIPETLRWLHILDIAGLQPAVQRLQQQPDQQGLRRFLEDLLTMSSQQRLSVVAEISEAVKELDRKVPEFYWVTKLLQDYPQDIGVIAPLFLNLICLQPGEAMYLAAGDLHAYLQGTGIELMANSDNVLRGGLTRKHVDVAELLTVLSFREKKPAILTPRQLPSGEKLYETPAEEFSLAVISVSQESPFSSRANRSVEILICTAGDAWLTAMDSGKKIHLLRGRSVLVPAVVKEYHLKGRAEIYRATVPI